MKGKQVNNQITEAQEEYTYLVDFDGTLTKNNTHNLADNLGIKAKFIGSGIRSYKEFEEQEATNEDYQKGRVEQFKKEYLTPEGYLQDKTSLFNFFTTLLGSGRNIAIVSYNKYPELILMALNDIGLTENQISKVLILVGFPVDMSKGKNEHIELAMKHFQLKDYKKVVLVDDDLEFNIAKAQELGVITFHAQPDSTEHFEFALKLVAQNDDESNNNNEQPQLDIVSNPSSENPQVNLAATHLMAKGAKVTGLTDSGHLVLSIDLTISNESGNSSLNTTSSQNSDSQGETRELKITPINLNDSGAQEEDDSISINLSDKGYGPESESKDGKDTQEQIIASESLSESSSSESVDSDGKEGAQEEDLVSIILSCDDEDELSTLTSLSDLTSPDRKGSYTEEFGYEIALISLKNNSETAHDSITTELGLSNSTTSEDINSWFPKFLQEIEDDNSRLISNEVVQIGGDADGN